MKLIKHGFTVFLDTVD